MSKIQERNIKKAKEFKMKVRWIPKEERMQVPKPVIVSTEYDALYFGEPRYIKAKLKEITGQTFMVSMQNDDDGNPRSGYPISDYVLVDARIQLFKDDVLLVRTDIYSDGSKRFDLFKNTRTEFKQRYEITEEDDNENLVVAKRTELIERLKGEGRQAEIPLELNKLMHALEADGTIEKQVLVNLVENKRRYK